MKMNDNRDQRSQSGNVEKQFAPVAMFSFFNFTQKEFQS